LNENEFCGSDAYFIAPPQKDQYHYAFGVSSGVDDYSHSGDFARGLMKKFFECAASDDYSTFNTFIIKNAHENLQKENPQPGGTTIGIYAVDLRQGKLYSSIVGDNGFMLIRNGFREHDSVRKRGHLAYKNLAGTKTYEDADTLIKTLEEKDIIIVGSHGFWTNLNAELVMDILKIKRIGKTTDDYDAKLIAKLLVDEAKMEQSKKSIDIREDITVVVALVTKNALFTDEEAPNKGKGIVIEVDEVALDKGKGIVIEEVALDKGKGIVIEEDEEALNIPKESSNVRHFQRTPHERIGTSSQ